MSLISRLEVCGECGMGLCSPRAAAVLAALPPLAACGLSSHFQLPQGPVYEGATSVPRCVIGALTGWIDVQAPA